jgi:hypothetical protein
MRLKTTPLKDERLRAITISAFGIVIWVLLTLVTSLRRFNLLGAQAFDLGIFQQGVWLLANGYTPFVTVRGWHLFADHFSPILFAFAPLYKILGSSFLALFRSNPRPGSRRHPTLPPRHPPHSKREDCSAYIHRLLTSSLHRDYALL